MTITELRDYFNMPPPIPIDRPCQCCGVTFTAWDRRKNWLCDDCKDDQLCEEVQMDDEEVDVYWEGLTTVEIDIDPEWWDYHTNDDDVDEITRELCD